VGSAVPATPENAALLALSWFANWRAFVPAECASDPPSKNAQSCRRRLGDEMPERAQLVDVPLRGVTGDDRGVDSPDRNDRRPVGMQVGLGQCFVDAGLICTKRTAALQPQENQVEGRPPWTALGVSAAREHRAG
jgi:hypothetical protein